LDHARHHCQDGVIGIQAPHLDEDALQLSCRDQARFDKRRPGCGDGQFQQALVLAARQVSPPRGVEQLFAGLDEEKRPVLELNLQGCTTREISVRLERAECTVRLLRAGVRHRLERMRRVTT
jgi:DNA-binding NarL/FixJ family response regulator